MSSSVKLNASLGCLGVAGKKLFRIRVMIALEHVHNTNSTSTCIPISQITLDMSQTNYNQCH